MRIILIIVALLFLGFYGYDYFQPQKASTVSVMSIDTNKVVFTADDLKDIPPTYNESAPTLDLNTTLQNQPSFACDGRQHCSQMTSCAEATYFSNNCPNTKMDGNNDDVPCEQQWCN